MKLTKGKINKIKGKRNQSKKRLGHKHKHLVKHGRGLSYRKKRHFNLKNQTLKRFGIEVGGTVLNNTTNTPESVTVKNENADTDKSATLKNGTVPTAIAENKTTTNGTVKNENVPTAIAENKTTTNGTVKNETVPTAIAENKTATNGTNASISVATVPVESNVASNSTTTTNDNKPNLPVATNVTPVYAIPVNGEDQTHDYNNMYNAMYNANNASESTSRASTATSSTAPSSTLSNKVVSKLTNRDNNISKDPTAIQPVQIKSVTPASKRAVTTTPPTIDNKITPAPNPVVTTPVVVTPSTPKTIVTIPATAPIDKKNQTPSTNPPQFVNLPDHFGPSTTMAELANYFSNVFLVQLMSKFDINTSMTLRDILLTMNKVNNNMGNNMGLNNNGIGIGSGSVNANGARSVGMMNNANPYSRTSQDLQKDLNITIDPGIDNNGNMGQEQNGNNNNGNANGYGDNYMNPNMGMGMGMGGPMSGYTGGPTDDVNPKDTRSRLDIQNENADMELDNANRSSENKELSEKINKNEAELAKLKSDPTADPARIKELETENQRHKNTITKNENVMTDNDRKKKANISAEWKTKSNWEVVSDVGRSAHDYGKRGLNAFGDAASSAYTGTKDFAKQTMYGKDVDVLDQEHDALNAKKTANDQKLLDLNAELNKTEPKKTLAETQRINKEIQKATTEKTNINNAITENRKKHTTKMNQIDDIIKSHNNPEAPVSTNRIDDERVDEHPTSTVLEGRKANEIEENGHLQETKSVKEGSRINSEIEEGDKRSIGRVVSDKLSDLNNKRKNAFSSMFGSKSESNIEHSESNIEHMQMLNDARKAKQMVENERKNQTQHSVEHKQSGQQHHEKPQHKNQHRHSRGGGKKTKTKKTRKLQKR